MVSCFILAASRSASGCRQECRDESGVRFIAAGLTVTALVPFPRPAIAAVDDAKACAVETARQEQRAAIPDHLLHAISLVESGRWDTDHRMRFAWPWTVTGQGDGRFL